MGSEDEAEQSIGRPCRQTNGRSKRTNELTSSIVPRGTSFHRSVELECPPIGSDLARLSCRCRGLFPGPAELGAVHRNRLSTAAMSMSPTGSRFSSESAPRPFHHGIRGRGGTIFGRPCRQTNGRSKRTCELTSSIVPRGTSFHRRVELEFPPIGSDPARVVMLLLRLVPGSSGTRCRQPRCGA